MSRPQPGRTREDTDLMRGRLEEYLKEQTADGAYRFKSRFIAGDLESSPEQIGQLVYQLRQDDETPLTFEKLAYSGATQWEVRRDG